MKHAYNLDEAKGQHTHSKENGYQPAEYEHQEYPKQVGSDGGRPIIAKNAEEEAAYLEAHPVAEEKAGA